MGEPGIVHDRNKFARVRQELGKQLDSTLKKQQLETNPKQRACSWGARMPWLPIRRDPRLVKHLMSGGRWHGSFEDRPHLCRLAIFATLASANASQGCIGKRSTRNLTHKTAFIAWKNWASVAAKSQGSARTEATDSMNTVGISQTVRQGEQEPSHQPRFTRGRGRYEVWNQLQRTTESRIELAVDKARGGLPVILKVYYPREWVLGPAVVCLH